MKIINGACGIGSALTKSQIIEFLSAGKMNLCLGTIDEKNHPNIHPVWYVYENERLYIATETRSKKIQNIKQNEVVYFAIASEKIPFIGVRGKGDPKILEDKNKNSDIAKKLIVKYLGNFENKMSKEIIEEMKNGDEVVVEITPKYFSTTNFESYFP